MSNESIFSFQDFFRFWKIFILVTNTYQYDVNVLNTFRNIFYKIVQIYLTMYGCNLNSNTFTTIVFRHANILRHPYLGQAIEASKEFIEYGNQFLCSALGWHFGETHDVSKEDATICSIKMSVSKMSKISLHPQEYSAQLISTVRLTLQSISEWDIIMLYTIAN